jgi:hypothetical protein
MEEQEKEKNERKRIEKLKKINKKAARKQKFRRRRRKGRNVGNEESKLQRIQRQETNETLPGLGALEPLSSRSARIISKKQKRLSSLKKEMMTEKVKEELKECTFKPRINKRSKIKRRRIEDLFVWQTHSRAKRCEKETAHVIETSQFHPKITKKSKEICEKGQYMTEQTVEDRLLLKAKNKRKKLDVLREQKYVGLFQPDIVTDTSRVESRYKSIDNTRYARERSRRKEEKLLEMKKNCHIRNSIKKKLDTRNKEDSSLEYERLKFKLNKSQRIASKSPKKKKNSMLNLPKKASAMKHYYSRVQSSKKKSVQKRKKDSSRTRAKSSKIRSKSRSKSTTTAKNRPKRDLSKPVRVPSKERIEKAADAMKMLNIMLGDEFQNGDPFDDSENDMKFEINARNKKGSFEVDEQVLKNIDQFSVSNAFCLKENKNKPSKMSEHKLDLCVGFKYGKENKKKEIDIGDLQNKVNFLFKRDKLKVDQFNSNEALNWSKSHLSKSFQETGVQSKIHL